MMLFSFILGEKLIVSTINGVPPHFNTIFLVISKFYSSYNLFSF